MKVTITNIARFTTNKDGEPLKTKDGRPYTSLRMQVQEHGDKWLSGFGNQVNAGWQKTDMVDVEIEEKKVGENTYLNFKTPKDGGNSEIMEELRKINFKLDLLVRDVSTDNGASGEATIHNTGIASDYPTEKSEDIDLDDPNNF